MISQASTQAWDAYVYKAKSILQHVTSQLNAIENIVHIFADTVIILQKMSYLLQ